LTATSGGGSKTFALSLAPPPTYNISGTVSSGAGATVTLSGAASKTATADPSGNFTFTGLANGSYTVAASLLGYTVTPASQAVTVNNASVAGINSAATLIIPTVSSLDCTPASFTAAGSALCTLTLSSAAVSGGSSVTLSSSNTNATVPPSMTVSAGAISGTFTAAVALVSSAQTATLTATSGGGSKTFALSLAPPPTYNISGNVSGGAGATVTLSGAASKTVTADPSGNFTFTGLANGSYTIAASLLGYTVTPASQAVTVNNANVAGINSAATLIIPTVSSLDCTPASFTSAGSALCTLTLSSAAVTGGSSVTLSSSNTNATVPPSTTVAAGAISGTFTAAVALVASTQTATLTATSGGGSKTFALSLAPPPTYNISGTVSGGAGATVTLSGAASKTATADSSGNFTFTGLANGSYTVAASLNGYTIAPASQAVTVNNANVAGINSAATLIIPTVSSLDCTPASFTAAGSALCTVSLSSSASSSASIALSSNSASVTVPASVTVAAGATTANFSANVAQVTSAKSVALTATLGSSTRSFTLTLTPAATFSITGTIGPAAAGGAATVALSGAATMTTTADASGNYTFSGLANGTYQVAASKSGYTVTPASQTVTVSGANLTAVNFTAAAANAAPPSLEVNVSTDKLFSAKVTSPSFSTQSTNELLVAVVNSTGAGTIVTSISGGGLQWSLVVRSHVQRATSEIWRAYAPSKLTSVAVVATLSQFTGSSMTILSYSGVDGSGTNGSAAIGATASTNSALGAPSAFLVTTRNNSLIIAGGTDPKKATSRVPASGQTIVHQFLSSGTNDTFWVQALNGAVSVAGTRVTISDTAPASDPFTLGVVEIVPPLGTISMTVDRTVLSMAPASRSSSSNTSGNQVMLTNLASESAEQVCSPGGLATLSGVGLTSQDPQTSNTKPLPTSMGGVQVLINGEPASLLYTSASRVNFQCPRLSPGTLLQVAAKTENGSILTAPPTLMLAAAPALFGTGEGKQGAIIITESNAIAGEGSVARPAEPGEHLTVYASGLGEVTDSRTASGSQEPADGPVHLVNRLFVSIGGIEGEPESVGMVQSMPGVYQITLQVPEGIRSGSAVPVHLASVFLDGTRVTSNVVTVAIRSQFR